MTRLIRKASPAFRLSLFYCPRTYIFITKQRKTVIKMSLWELFILAVGLSMDAFAVSVCKGLSVKKLKAKHMLTVGAYFGGFQALMPLLGYILGIQFQSMIQQFDHWIAFVLLVLIGLSMIKESREEAENLNDSFSFKTMLPLAVATSIDALAVGVTFCCFCRSKSYRPSALSAQRRLFFRRSVFASATFSARSINRKQSLSAASC